MNDGDGATMQSTLCSFSAVHNTSFSISVRTRSGCTYRWKNKAPVRGSVASVAFASVLNKLVETMLYKSDEKIK